MDESTVNRIKLQLLQRVSFSLCGYGVDWGIFFFFLFTKFQLSTEFFIDHYSVREEILMFRIGVWSSIFIVPKYSKFPLVWICRIHWKYEIHTWSVHYNNVMPPFMRSFLLFTLSIAGETLQAPLFSVKIQTAIAVSCLLCIGFFYFMCSLTGLNSWNRKWT